MPYPADDAVDTPDSTAAVDPPRTKSGIVARTIAWLLRLRLVRSFLHYSEHRGPLLADSVTYRALFSVFAGVLLGFSIAGLWLQGNPTAWNALIDAVDAAIPGLVGKDGIIDPDSVAVPAGLTIAGVISLVGLVGAAIGAIGSLRTALLLLADRISDDVMFVWVMLRNLALAIGIGAALLASAAVTFAGTAFLDTVGEWLGVPSGSALLVWGGRILALLVTFALDAAVIAVAFLLLSGLRPRALTLWRGALLGGVGLTVLQQLSGLFVGGASSNPLLASFASLIALLLWFNLSAQVILIASAIIIVGMQDDTDRVRSVYGAQTFAQRRVQRAERAVMAATDELDAARRAVADS